MLEERWTLFNVRRGNFKCFLIQKSIPNSYFFSFRWFLIYLITKPAVFLNKTHLVRLGIFHLDLGKNHTFWLWEWGRISAPNFGDREPWCPTSSCNLASYRISVGHLCIELLMNKTGRVIMEINGPVYLVKTSVIAVIAIYQSGVQAPFINIAQSFIYSHPSSFYD